MEKIKELTLLADAWTMPADEGFFYLPNRNLSKEIGKATGEQNRAKVGAINFEMRTETQRSKKRYQKGRPVDGEKRGH